MRELRIYWCPRCQGYTITVQLAAGNVERMISCRSRGFGECDGTGHLLDTLTDLVPTEPIEWEWVRPDTHAIVSTENRGVEVALRNALILRKHHAEVSS